MASPMRKQVLRIKADVMLSKGDLSWMLAGNSGLANEGISVVAGGDELGMMMGDWNVPRFLFCLCSLSVPLD